MTSMPVQSAGPDDCGSRGALTLLGSYVCSRPLSLRLCRDLCGTRRLVALLPPAETRAMSCGEDRMTKRSRHWRTQFGVLSRPVPPNDVREACRDADADADAEGAATASLSNGSRAGADVYNTPLAASRVAGFGARRRCLLPANHARRCANAVVCLSWGNVRMRIP
jgi:hypothetical protein